MAKVELNTSRDDGFGRGHDQIRHARILKELTHALGVVLYSLGADEAAKSPASLIQPAMEVPAMRSNSLLHLTSGVLLAILLLLSACHQVVDPVGNTEEVFFRFEQASVSEHVLSGATETTGTFTASGAVVDQGRYEEVMAIGESRIYGYRSLDGARGTVVMQFIGLVSDDGKRGRIQVTIHQGTGEYASLAGSDTVEITLAPGASPLETMNTFTAQLGQE